MTVYIVQGKLGAGKSKYCVDKIRQALAEGRRVATNMDVFLEHLCRPQSRATIVRLPDKPTAADLEAIGHGNPDSYDEDRNGLLVLDEAASWFNSRQFMDEARKALIDWFLHARKYGWDVLLPVQDVNMIDKQFRVGLAEILVRCIRADKMRLPIVGVLLGKRGRLPRFHIANHSLADVPGVVTDREFYRGDDLHKAYDTRQIFWADYPHGVHSLLSAWHVHGRYARPAKRGFWARLFVPVSTVQPKDKRALVARLAALPPDRAMYWAARLAREGIV